MKTALRAVAFAAAVHASPLAQSGGVTAILEPKTHTPAGCSRNFDGHFALAVVPTLQNMAWASDGKEHTEYFPILAREDNAAVVERMMHHGHGGYPPSSTYETPTPIYSTTTPIYSTSTPTYSTTTPTYSTSHITYPTSEVTYPTPTYPTVTYPPMSEIPDGQPQAPPATMIPPPVISQIPDGQLQAPPAPPCEHCTPMSQIPDGQVQAPPGPPPPAAPPAASQIYDGQVQAPPKHAMKREQQQKLAPPSICDTKNIARMTLQDGILKDAQGRVGYIAANRQFQFDGPPQAGAVVTSGFSICSDGKMALGGQKIFSRCLSGNFYNLYDQNEAGQCSKADFNVIKVVSC